MMFWQMIGYQCWKLWGLLTTSKDWVEIWNTLKIVSVLRTLQNERMLQVRTFFWMHISYAIFLNAYFRCRFLATWMLLHYLSSTVTDKCLRLHNAATIIYNFITTFFHCEGRVQDQNIFRKKLFWMTLKIEPEKVVEQTSKNMIWSSQNHMVTSERQTIPSFTYGELTMQLMKSCERVSIVYFNFCEFRHLTILLPRWRHRRRAAIRL